MDDVRDPMKNYDACEAMHLIPGDASNFSFLEPFHVVVWTNCLVVCVCVVVVWTNCLVVCVCVREVCESLQFDTEPNFVCERKRIQKAQAPLLLACSLVRARLLSLSLAPTHTF